MTADLRDLYTARAGRASIPADHDDVMSLVTELARQRARRRRTRIAAGCAVVAVTAVATVGAAVSDTHQSRRPAGDRPTPSASQDASRQAATRAARRAAEDRARAQAAARRVAARQAQLRTALSGAAHDMHLRAAGRISNDGLVAIAAAPPSAEISIGLAPKGYVYRSKDAADTYYGPASSTQPVGYGYGLAVDVHLTLPRTSFPITIDGRPASLNDYGGIIQVAIKYDDRVDVGFEASADVHLTPQQAIEIAMSIDVRSTNHSTKG